MGQLYLSCLHLNVAAVNGVAVVLITQLLSPC